MKIAEWSLLQRLTPLGISSIPWPNVKQSSSDELWKQELHSLHAWVIPVGCCFLFLIRNQSLLFWIQWKAMLCHRNIISPTKGDCFSQSFLISFLYTTLDVKSERVGCPQGHSPWEATYALTDDCTPMHILSGKWTQCILKNNICRWERKVQRDQGRTAGEGMSDIFDSNMMVKKHNQNTLNFQIITI